MAVTKSREAGQIGPYLCGSDYLIKGQAWSFCPPQLDYTICDAESEAVLLHCSHEHITKEAQWRAKDKKEAMPTFRVTDPEGKLVMRIASRWFDLKASFNPFAKSGFNTVNELWDAQDRLVGLISSQVNIRLGRQPTLLCDAAGRELARDDAECGPTTLFFRRGASIASFKREVSYLSLLEVFRPKRITARPLWISDSLSWDDPVRYLILAHVLSHSPCRPDSPKTR